MNKEKKAIYDAALDEAKKLKIGNYHTEFIAYMVYRNIKHPTEKMDVLAEKAMDYINIKNKRMSIKMFNIIMRLLMILLVLFGVILIYDARIITKKFFGFGDQNEGSSGLKILGFIIAIIGGLALYFLCK